MKKSTILILSAIFIIMIFIPFNVKALDNVTLVVDYEDEDFQEFYNTNIESRLDTMINSCRNHMDSDNIMLSYGLLASNIEFLCFNIDRISSAEFTVGSNQYSSTSYSSYLRANGSIDYIRLRISDLSPIFDKVNNADLNYFNFFYSSNYDSSSSEFYTNFLPNTSWATIPFYSDKDIFVFTNNNNKNNGLFINGTYIQYGETISFYANNEQSFLPNDYDYIETTPNLDVNIPYIDVELSFPVLSDYVPYAFNYNSYFILDSEPDYKYYLDGSYYNITSDYIAYGKDVTFLKKYTLYKNATYYFEIYEGNSLDSNNLLQTDSFYTGNIGTNFVGPDYIDNPNKDNTSNIFGESIFSNFKTPDYGFSTIITAPLRLINSFNTDVCTAPSIPILGANFTLPCGQTFWNREDITEFKEIYQIIIYGLLCYYIGLDIVRIIQDLKNPDDSKLNVIDL